MRLATIEPLLRSPCCWVALNLEPSLLRDSGRVLWSGQWTCTACGNRFPHRRGVAFLSVLDADWLPTLRESVARRLIVLRQLHGGGLEPQREQLLSQQNETSRDLMQTLFDAALNRMQPLRGLRVLDVGAGTCPTSAQLAALGAEVVAVETEPAHLLHVNLEPVDPEPPETLILNGVTYRTKPATPAPAYFSRITAPAHRLPFYEASFDVVFCRSVLHHLHALPRAMREMLRVLRPGGLFVACSEPVRSILDPEDDYLIENVDKEEGLNEQTPALTDYLAPLRGLTRQVTVQHWPSDPPPGRRTLLRRLAAAVQRRMPVGSCASGPALAMLLPMSFSVNIYACRTLVRVPLPPRSTNLLDEFGISELAGWSTPATLRNAIETHERATNTFAAAARRLAALSRREPSVFVPALTPERDLRIGWRRRETVLGHACRTMTRRAMVSLARSSQMQRLEIMACATMPQPVTGRILADGQPVGRFGLEHQWKQIVLPLRSSGDVVDVTLELDDADAPPGRVAVRWIRLI
jgi:ubiquinone/menaquinone biosynthesis C-methylase UbiE